MNTLHSGGRQRLPRAMQRMLALTTITVVGRTLFYAGIDAFSDYVFGDPCPPRRERPVSNQAELDSLPRHHRVRNHRHHAATRGPLAHPRVA